MCLRIHPTLSCSARANRRVRIARPAGIAALLPNPVALARRHDVARHSVKTAAVSQLAARMQPFSGCNCYYLLEKMSSHEGEEMVRRTLDAIHNMGFSVIRMWAFNDGEGGSGHQLQSEPGTLNPNGLKDLDNLFQVLDEINFQYSPKPRMQLMMTLTNHLTNYGGHWFYLRQPHASPDDFYYSEAAKDAYRNYVTSLIDHCKKGKTSRGTPYMDLIHSWDICNEPRNKSHKKPGDVTKWVADAAAAIKKADGGAKPVTVGLEGFYGPGDPDKHRASNPYGDKVNGAGEGIEFKAIGELDDIDFMSIHLWTDQWRTNVPKDIVSWSKDWVTGHMDLCQNHLGGKPLCLQEYNLSVNAKEDWAREHLKPDGRCLATPADRKALFEMVRTVMEDENKDNVLIGHMVWMVADAEYADDKQNDKEGHMIVLNRDPSSEEVLRQMCAEAMARHKPQPAAVTVS